MSTLQPENFYFTTTTSTVSSLTTDGSFTVSSAPSGVRGWLILSYDDESKREVIKYYNVSGSTIYYRGIDRPSPKEHVTGSKVMMADSAEHMKYFEGLIGDTFYLEKISALVVKCWGGKVRIAGVEYDISDQASLAITDDDDTYVYLDLDDQTLKVTTTLATAQSGVLLHTVTASSGAITSIVNHTTKDYFYDHTHDDRYYTETESDANFAAIGHNHNLADLAEKNYSSLDSRPEDDDFHTLTEELSAAADDDEILIWDTSASAYKRIAKNLVVPEVNDDDFYQNLDEELNNAADDDYVLIWDTSASAYKKIAKVRITPPGSVSTPWTTNGLNIYFNTGNIGLGVSSPTEKIDVDGNIKATGTVECDDPTVDEHAATKLYVDGKADFLSKYEKTIGEDIDGSTTPQAVCPINYTEGIYLQNDSNTNSSGRDDVSDWIGQRISMATSETIISSVEIYTKKTGSPTGSMFASIYSGTSTTPNTLLGTKEINFTEITTSEGYVKFEFDVPIEVDPSALTYFLVFGPTAGSTLNSSNEWWWYYDTNSSGAVFSSNSGSTWSSADISAYGNRYKVNGLTQESKASKASAVNTLQKNFIGFIHGNYSDDESAIIEINKIQNGFSGLEDGEKYYLSDTPGAISTTPGTNTVLIGVAVSETELLIVHDF
jgi:hypothetical protein